MRPVFALQTRPVAQTGATAQVSAPPAIDHALIDEFIAATDEARASMISARPQILAADFRAALAEAGKTHRNNGDLTASSHAYLALLFIGRRYQLPITEINALLGLGAVEGTRGDFPKAKSYLDDALAGAIANNYVPGRQQALSNLANVFRRTGDVDGAMDAAYRSLELAREVGDPLPLARVLNNLGNTLNDRGQGARAVEAYSESYSLKERNGAPIDELVRTLSNIGGVYAEQGDYPLAIEYYRRALGLIDTSAMADLISIVCNNLGQVYATLHENVLARQYLTRSLELANKINDPTRIATSLYILGSLARTEGKLDEAEATQRRVLAMRESSDDRLGMVESLSEIADLLASRNRVEEALPFGERAVTLAAESRLNNQLWKAQLTLGRLHARLGHDTNARALYERAIETIEILRQQAAGGERAEQGYLSERMGPYYALAELDVRAKKTFNALATVDRARARALVDILATGRTATGRLTNTQRDDDRRLTQAVLVASERVDVEAKNPQSDPSRLAALDAELASARTARERFLVDLYAEQPALRFARGNTPDVTPERLAALVSTDTALVTFVLDEDAAWVYVVTRGAAGLVYQTQRLSLSATRLTELADRFAHQIAARDLAFSANAHELYNALFGKIDASLLHANRIVLMPDGPLWHVPFQALQTPRGRFLIEERAVSYTPSIAALAALEDRQRARVAHTPFLVALGDPDTTVTTSPGAGTTTVTPTAMRGPAVSRLPEAAREVRALGRMYGAARSLVLVAGDASETALRTQVSKATVLHIATHGVLDDRNPMYSHLTLASPKAGVSPADHFADGRLEAWELLDLGITADIAVLSACQTAGSGGGWGEGMIGLSWSLFASGASTAVVSQWEVDSTNTTNLMIAFHQRLLTPTTKSAGAPEALRQAAITLLNNPASRHPFYWAGFVSVGAR